MEKRFTKEEIERILKEVSDSMIEDLKKEAEKELGQQDRLLMGLQVMLITTMYRAEIMQRIKEES